MSLISTLAKVAIGVAAAKGIGHLAKGSFPENQGRQPGTGRTGGAGHGLDGMMGEITGGRPGYPADAERSHTVSRAGQSSGGLGDLLGGGLGSLLNRVGSGSSRSGASHGGIGDLIGSLTGGGTGGGLGGLLGGLMGGGMMGGAQAPASGPSAGAVPQEQEVAAALMISAMVQAAKCDGALDEREKTRLMEHLTDAEPQERKFVNDLLAAPVDIPGLVAQVPEGMEEQVYAVSLLAIDLDSRAEADYLSALANALGIDKARLAAIHAEAGAPALQV